MCVAKNKLSVLKSRRTRLFVVEKICRGTPKSKIHEKVRMSRATFDRALNRLCEMARLPTDTSVWPYNRAAIIRNLERFEQYIEDSDMLFTKYRQSLEITDRFGGNGGGSRYVSNQQQPPPPLRDDLLK